MRAADGALTATAYEDAASFLEAALRLTSPDDAKRRGQLLLALGDAEKRISDSDKAREYYRTAAEIARGQHDFDALRRAALGFARSWPTVGSVDEEAVSLLREALESYDRSDATSVRAGIMARLALQLYYSGDLEEVKRLSAEAVAVARASGDRARLASVLQTRHVILWEPEYLNERLAIATEIIELAEGLGSEEVALWGHRPRIADYTELGAIDEMRNEVATYARLAEASRRPLYVWQSLVRRAMLASYEGRFAEAERVAQESLAVGQQAEGQNLMTAFGGQLLVIRWHQGRMAELEPFVRSSLEEQPHVLTWPAVLAFIFCETDRLAEAREAFEALYSDGPPALAADNTRLVDVVVLSLVCAQVASERHADELYGDLLRYEGRNIVLAEGVVSVGAADYYLGILAATMRRWDDAVRHLELAIEMNTKGEAAPWLALAQYDCARALLARRKSGDRQAARMLLEEARSSAGKLRMAVLVTRCDKLAKRSFRASNLEQDGLTGRELEVLRLVAQGRSSQEISDELSLSPRTTARHITNLYGKIGARNRSDATAYAIRQGLI
jgi:DNA-binding CsgD family transcriptional regulator/tetratricopeptide (TPR) repeat protein